MQDCGGQDIRWTTPLRLPIIKGHWILGQIFRGSVTFPIRMERINQSAQKIAEWLEKLKYVENIILKWNADWYNDEDTGIPDNEILEAIFNACTDNGFDIPIDEDYRRIYNNALNDIESEFLKCEKVHYNLQDILNVLNKVKAGASNENNS